MPHPIRTKEGLATERRTRGIDNHQNKTAPISEVELAFVTKQAQKVEHPRTETVKNKGKRGPAPFPFSGRTP